MFTILNYELRIFNYEFCLMFTDTANFSLYTFTIQFLLCTFFTQSRKDAKQNFRPQTVNC